MKANLEDTNQSLSSAHLGLKTTPRRALKKQCRVLVTLNAPTALTTSSNDLPITYLNQGVTYNISVLDTTAKRGAQTPSRYRTIFRLSFESEPQPRHRSRLTRTESSKSRGFPSIEYVKSSHDSTSEASNSQINLEFCSWDCLSITWTSNSMTGGSYCLIPIRFGLLSADFNQTADVDTSLFRLSANTERISSPQNPLEYAGRPDDCFIKIKLFGDQAAEKRLAEEIVRTKKEIVKLEKLTARFAMDEELSSKKSTTSSRGSGKARLQKKNAHAQSSSSTHHPTTTRKNEHMSTNSENLAGHRKTLSSTRPVSTFQQTSERDTRAARFPPPSTIHPQIHQQIEVQSANPEALYLTPSSDVHSVTSSPNLGRSTQQQRSIWPDNTPGTQPYPANVSAPHLHALETGYQNRPADLGPDHHGYFTPSPLISILRNSNTMPADNFASPTVCFYVRTEFSRDAHHRAIYLQQRNLYDLIAGIALKFQVREDSISRIICFDANSLQLHVDEAAVRTLPNGQDMMVQFFHNSTYPNQQHLAPDFHIAPGAFTPNSSACPSLCPSLSTDHELGENVDYDKLFHYTPGLTGHHRERTVATGSFPGEQQYLGPTEQIDGGMELLNVFPGPAMFSAPHDGNHLQMSTAGPSTFAHPGSLLQRTRNGSLDARENQLMIGISPSSGPSDSPISSQDLHEHARAGARPRVHSRSRSRHTPTHQQPYLVPPRMSPEVSRNDALERNRRAAAKCRSTKNERTAALLTESQQKMQQNKELKDTVAAMQAQVMGLREMLAAQERLSLEDFSSVVPDRSRSGSHNSQS